MLVRAIGRTLGFNLAIGTDATHMFEDIGHTSHARELMTKYCIDNHVKSKTEK